MKLSKYLKKHDVSCAELADKMDVTRQIVWGWAFKEGKPTGENLSKLEKATNGHVRMEDFYK